MCAPITLKDLDSGLFYSSFLDTYKCFNINIQNVSLETFTLGFSMEEKNNRRVELPGAECAGYKMKTKRRESPGKKLRGKDEIQVPSRHPSSWQFLSSGLSSVLVCGFNSCAMEQDFLELESHSWEVALTILWMFAQKESHCL